MDVPIEYIQTRAYEHKQRNHEFQSSSYVQMETGELGVTYLNELTTCMYDGCLAIIAVVVWSYLDVDDSSVFDVSRSRGRHIDHADSGDCKAGSHTQLVCTNPGPCWHAPLAR